MKGGFREGIKCEKKKNESEHDRERRKGRMSVCFTG